MSVHALTLGTFEADAAAQDVAIITYGASWCGHCLTFAPVFSSISAHYPSVFFGTVDTESQPTLAREAGIRSVPTVVLLRHGVVMGRHS
ncbi:TPA: thioredoxin family protein, partial [Enterococcus faecium]|nr:thioredoxin family protein [Enterococcus faecium]